MSQKFLVKKGLAGRGLFTIEAASAGQALLEYKGRHVLDEETTPWNVSRYINHSCAPNCVIERRRGVLWIVAKFDLFPGEELTYEYEPQYLKFEGGCRCPVCE